MNRKRPVASVTTVVNGCAVAPVCRRALVTAIGWCATGAPSVVVSRPEIATARP